MRIASVRVQLNDPHTYRLQVCIILRKMNSIRNNRAAILLLFVMQKSQAYLILMQIYVFVFICTVQYTLV